MPELHSATQTGLAYDRLREEILHGALMPGERLRASGLQDRFQLGLTPIREALMRLANEGLVETESHRGARVSDASAAGFADLMAARRTIERHCLVQAMQRGDAVWEAEIITAQHLLARAALPETTQDRNTAAAWEVLHRRFHAALIAACGSDWLQHFWNQLADHSARYRKIRLLHHRDAIAEVRDLAGEHRALADAVLARDIDRAPALMDAHLLATERSVARFLNDDTRAAKARPGRRRAEGDL